MRMLIGISLFTTLSLVQQMLVKGPSRQHLTGVGRVHAHDLKTVDMLKFSPLVHPDRMDHNLTAALKDVAVGLPWVLVQTADHTVDATSWRYVRLRGVRGKNVVNRVWLGAWHMLSALTWGRLLSPSLQYIGRDTAEELHLQFEFRCGKNTYAGWMEDEWDCSSTQLHGVWHVINPVFQCPVELDSLVELDKCLLSYELAVHLPSTLLFTLHFIPWAAVTGMTIGTLFILAILAHLMLQPKTSNAVQVFGLPLLTFMVSTALLINEMLNISTRHSREFDLFAPLAALVAQFMACSQSFGFLRCVLGLDPHHIASHQLQHKLFTLHNSHHQRR
jgi:hypothetical protein